VLLLFLLLGLGDDRFQAVINCRALRAQAGHPPTTPLAAHYM
jgi:hypothetical protein